MSFRNILQAAIRHVFSWEVMRIAENAYAVTPTALLHEAWFSLEAQRRLLMDRLGIDLVVDVGANVGQFGQAIRRTYTGELVSFEPSSGPFVQLCEAAAKDPLWRVVNCALGSEDAYLDLQIAPLSVLNSFLPPSEFGQATFGERAKPSSYEKVRVRRLDETLNEIIPLAGSKRLLVKLDTQGFDLQVFAGMTRLQDAVVALQSEVSLRQIYEGMPNWLESLAVYQAAGFRVVGMFPAAFDQASVPIEYDCLMVRDTSGTI